jgi:UDP-glucose 4-epimerase
MTSPPSDTAPCSTCRSTAATGFIEADVLTGRPWMRSSVDADVVVHLAAITNAAGSFQNVKQVEQVNFEGTDRVAQACARTTGVPLIFLSTTSVYGTQAESSMRTARQEELKPQSPYADSKLRAERLLLQPLGREQGLALRDVPFRHDFRCFAGDAIPHGGEQVHLAGVSWGFR